MEVNGAWVQGRRGGALSDLGSCLEQPLEPNSVAGGAGGAGRPSEGAGVNRQTHSRHGVAGGAWVGAGQDRTVLNSFSLKSVLGLQGYFFFSLLSFF